MKRLLIFVVFLALLPTLASATTVRGYCMEDREKQLLDYINQYRVENGLNRVKPMQELGAAAEHHSRSMARYDYFAHDLLAEGITWSENIKRHNYRFNTWLGENIAAGNASPYATFMQWVNSPPHNAILLDPKMRAVGIGRFYKEESRYGWYWTLDVGGVFERGIRYCN